MNINKIKTALFLISLVLLVIASTLISHTVRLSIYSKRFIVRSMQLVGATNAFIMKPFLKTFLIQGLLASFMALVLISMTLLSMGDYFPDLSLIQGNAYVVVIYLLVILLSLLLTLFSTIFAMRKYLDADLDEFYV